MGRRPHWNTLANLPPHPRPTSLVPWVMPQAGAPWPYSHPGQVRPQLLIFQHVGILCWKQCLGHGKARAIWKLHPPCLPPAPWHGVSGESQSGRAVCNLRFSTPFLSAGAEDPEKAGWDLKNSAHVWGPFLGLLLPPMLLLAGSF